MFQDILPHEFHNEFAAYAPSGEDYVLLFQKEQLWAKSENGNMILPKFKEIPALDPNKSRYLFSIDRRKFFWYNGDGGDLRGFSLFDIADFRKASPSWYAFAAATGLHLVRWYRRRRFCGDCGAPMAHSETERALVCPNCGNVEYPTIAPSVIVAVTHGDKLLLTKYTDRPYKKYALVAGYNEIGETLEDTVHREVQEEVGLKVRDLRYYKSQPWPFTDTLLMGFFAEVEGDDKVTLADGELSEARWFSRENLPATDNTVSLTNEMIEQFRNGDF